MKGPRLFVNLLAWGVVWGQTPNPVDALLIEAQRLMENGRYQAARQRLRDSSDPRSLRLLIELAQRRGDRASALRYAGQLLASYQRGDLQTATDLAQAAFAAWQLDYWHRSNEIFMEASEKEPVAPAVFIDWGNLYLERYNPAEAAKIFGDALKQEEHKAEADRWDLAAAYIGLARAQRDQQRPGTEEALKKASQLNPNSLELIAFRAGDAVRQSSWKEAQRLIKKGLKLNNNYLPLLQIKTAYHYFKGEKRAEEKARQQVLAINPSNAGLFELLGDLCVSRRRLQEAIDFYRQAVRQNPRQWSAMASLGINLLRVGKEKEGQQILESAYENDPFNLWTVNTLRLLDSFDDFTRFDTEHFSVKVAAKESVALRPYVETLLERSLQALSRKYDHQVTGKYVFEIYPNHEDFAVRTLGLPGLGALGATFGRVVAMDSPSARPEGKFHWGSTLWHEVAHVVTLSISNQKVPRWFTEGLSMREERLAYEGWGEFLTPAFVQAYKEDKLLPLGELESGFQSPRFAGQLELSYLQSAWVCDFLAENYGDAKIKAMLVAFGQDETLEQVFKSVLGISLEDFDKLLREELESELRPLVERLQPLQPTESLSEELSPADWIDLAEAHPQNYFSNLNAARQLLGNDRSQDAVPYLEQALELFPYSAEMGSPYHLLANIYRQQGNVRKTTDVLARWWKVAPHFPETGLELAELLSESGRMEEATEVLENVMYVDPFEPGGHRHLGELYLAAQRSGEAVREFKILLSLQPQDWAGAYYLLARALAQQGERREARQQLLFSLELAPTFEEAQKFLLKLVREP